MPRVIPFTETRVPGPFTRTALGLRVLAAACLLAFGAETGAQAQGEGQGPPPAPVVVAPVVEREVTRRISLIGTAEPWLETVLAAQESGLVKRLLVDEGDRVEEGQVLCEQDSSQIRLSIASARASLAEARVVKAQADRELERQQRLYKIQSVSQKAFEDAQFEANARAKEVLRLESEVLVLEDKREKMTIRAPTGGYVVKRHALIGQWLSPGDPVVTLSVLDPIRFMLPVPGYYIHSVAVGDTVQVTFDGLPGRMFEGRIAAVIPRGNEAARTFPVRVEIPNADGDIKAGFLGRASLPIGGTTRAVLVPKDALVLGTAGNTVWVVRDGAAFPVAVETGAAHGPQVEVQGELAPPADVVVRGNERLFPGQPVNILRQDERGPR